MLTNLSKARNFRSKFGKHKRMVRREYKEAGREWYDNRDLMRLKKLNFDKIFKPTEYTGVYACHGTESLIHDWCKQTPVYYKFFKKARKMRENGTDSAEIAKAKRNAWDFGVADNIEQIIDYYNSRDFKGNHVIFINKVTKDPDPEATFSGWRWHKWGRYIGTQHPQCEYLNDEPDITEVLCFSIYQVV